MSSPAFHLPPPPPPLPRATATTFLPCSKRPRLRLRPSRPHPRRPSVCSHAPSSPWPNSPFQLSDIVSARYRITALLGRGANGITYEAESLLAPTSARLALKALSFKSISTWKALDLFEREAAALRALDHPAIPRYLDFLELDLPNDRVYVLVQRKAPGRSLQALLDDGARFSTPHVAAVFTQLLQVLDYLASLNPPVLHRDVKPANVILGFPDGQPRLSLVDFGAVNAARTASLGSTMVGTFGYMAPEQFGGAADVRSDLYAAAATVLCMLTGRAPSSLPQKRLKIDVESVIPERERLKLGNVYTVMVKLLEPAPEDRYDSARDALDALLSRRDTSREDPAQNGGMGNELLQFGSSLSAEEATSLTRAFANIGTTQEEPRGGGPLGRLTDWAGRRMRRRKPVGSRVVLDRDRSNRLLRLTIPPKGLSGNAVSKGTFAVAWTGFTAFWTVGVLTGGAPIFFSLFSIPFWAAGVQMARNAVEEVSGITSLVISFGGGAKEVFYFGLTSKGAFGRKNFVEGDARDLDQALVETEMYVNGQPVTDLVLQEGTRRYVLGKGLDIVEQEWLRDEINDFLQPKKRW